MKVLITGGAGFFGLHMTKKCVDMGENVTLLDIAEYDKSEYDKSVKLVKGDVRDTEIMDKLISENDVVIHAAAALPLEKKKEIFSTNVDGTRNVLELCFKHKTKKFVMISSTAVYGVPDHHPLFETDKMIGVGPYGESKIAGEKICNEYRDKGLFITIVRPKTFIGTHRLGVFQILYNWVEEGHKIPTIGNGKNRYQLLEVDDLCDAVHLAYTSKNEKANGVFNIGAVSNLSANDYLGALCEYAGSGSTILHTPVVLVIPALMLFEWLHISPLYKWVYGTAHKDSFVSVDKAREILGWNPKYDESQALIRSYQWYQDNKAYIAKGTGTSHRVPWAQGILGIIKKFL
ncbi:MAG TPA: NAD(P)-dependent oxidoreductase [bacterium]|nr:NAD(P)-dependent oxidoreductase [bacterium]